MNAPRLIVSFIALLFSSAVYHVHAPSSNKALLLVAAVSILIEVALFLGGVLLNVNARILGDWTNVAETGFGRVAFLVTWGSIALYGACTCLAIELLIRTRSPSMLHRRDSVRRGFYYAVPSLMIPFVLACVTVGLRLGGGPVFTPAAACGNDSDPVVFFVVYVVVLWVYSIVGTIFTVWAIVVYTRRRKTIMRSLASSNTASSTMPTLSVFSKGGRTIKNSRRQDLVETASVSSLSSSSSSENDDEESDIDLPTQKSKSPFHLRPKRPARKLTANSTTPRTTPQAAPHRSSKLARRRMIIWSVGFHALNSINLVITTVSSIPALKLYLNGEVDTTSIESTRTARTVTVIWATGGLAALQFLCFGFGEGAWGRYVKVFPFLKRFENVDVAKAFKRRLSFGGKKGGNSRSAPRVLETRTLPSPLPSSTSTASIDISTLTAAGWKISTGGSVGSRPSVSAPSHRDSGTPTPRIPTPPPVPPVPTHISTETPNRPLLPVSESSSPDAVTASSTSNLLQPPSTILNMSEPLPGLPLESFQFSDSDTEEDGVVVERLEAGLMTERRMSTTTTTTASTITAEDKPGYAREW
ncbi:hypothetical protein HDV05_001588 [Chytridiales sp. JEL 0842]|nr:hypothetical protein HDV05_001588 [Chytridiales sp. JEL 0842]